MRRLLITTVMVALVASIATANDAYVPAAYAPAFTAPPEQHDVEVTAACRAAGDPATPPPEHAKLVGRVLLLDGGDHRALAIMRNGKVYLRCVHALYVAQWVRDRR